MFKKLVIPTAIVTAFACAPVLADAGDKGGSKAERQHEMDTGSPATAGAKATQSFNDLDQNRDGQLDEEELNVWGSTAAGSATGNQEDPARGQRMMQRYDRNDDGTVSRDEMDQGPMTGTDIDQ